MGAYLSMLQDAINQKSVKLHTHAHILEEWKKHSQKDAEQKSSKLKKRHPYFATTSSNLPAKIEISEEHLKIQREIITDLLASAMLIGTPKLIENEFAERFRKKLAPLHAKRESQNDWEIIGSACHYCQINGIEEFYFISSNSTDFADPKNPDQIHPDLAARFPEVKIYYFHQFSDFFRDLEKRDLSLDLRKLPLVQSGRFAYGAARRKTILESLYYLFHDIYGEVAFIPIPILLKYYPIQDPEILFGPFYSIFTLNNISQALLSVFEQLKFNGKTSFEFKVIDAQNSAPDYRKKLEYVLTRLNQNLIFELNNAQPNERIEIEFRNADPDPDYFQNFERLAFGRTAVQMQSTEENDTRGQLRKAYVLTAMGDFDTAAKSYSFIRSKAENAGEYILSFIATYNLYQLRRFLKNEMFRTGKADKEIEEAEKIDILTECLRLKNKSAYELISHIATGDFYSEALDEINESYQKLIEHYQLQLKGGRSSNSNIWILISAYSNLESFINLNYIVFDIYSNYERIFDLVLQGILASYAMDDRQSARFEDFDDYWTTKIILHSNKTKLLQYLRRFELKTLKYIKTGQSGDTFIELAANLFSDLSPKGGLTLATQQHTYFRVSQKYLTYFENIMTLAMVLDLEAGDEQSFAELLFDFMRNSSEIPYHMLEVITPYIRNKAPRFSAKLKFNFLELFLSNITRFGEDATAAILKAMENDSLVIKNIDEINSGFLQHEGLNISLKVDLLTNLYLKGKPKVKTDVSNAVSKTLSENFNFQLYYASLLSEVIPFEDNFFLERLNALELPNARDIRDFHVFDAINDHAYHYADLDAMLNLWFKFKKGRLPLAFDRFKTIDAYYEWLIGIEDFDYSQFSPKWITEYQTKYFFDHISKSKGTMKAVKAYLRANSSPRVSAVYTQLNLHMD